MLGEGNRGDGLAHVEEESAALACLHDVPIACRAVFISEAQIGVLFSHATPCFLWVE